jgi:flagellar motor switch protein FliM
MPQTLSQDEVDALLKGLDSGEVPTEAAPSQPSAAVKGDVSESMGDVRPYDFTRSELSIRNRLPGLEIIFGKFTRSMRNLFVSELGRSADAGFNDMEVVVYEDFIKRIPLPASIHLFQLEPLRGVGVFVVEARLAYSLIDIFFGGGGESPAKLEGRDFTPIETNFLGRFVGKMLSGMEESWESVIPLRSRYLRSELNPYLLGATGMGEVMIMAAYKIEMVNVSGDILFAFPLSGFEEVREQLKSPYPVTEQSGGALKSRVHSHLQGVEVNVRAIVDIVEMDIQRILALRPGDIVQIDPQSMERVQLWVEGRPKFIGRAAQRNWVKVFSVSERMAAKSGSDNGPKTHA